ncbi:hypothetical protein CsSME_00021296 [Camellia sinensis var. sinensis]
MGAQEKSPTAQHSMQVRGFTVEGKAYFFCPRIEVECRLCFYFAKWHINPIFWSIAADIMSLCKFVGAILQMPPKFLMLHLIDGG